MTLISSLHDRHIHLTFQMQERERDEWSRPERSHSREKKHGGASRTGMKDDMSELENGSPFTIHEWEMPHEDLTSDLRMTLPKCML